MNKPDPDKSQEWRSLLLTSLFILTGLGAIVSLQLPRLHQLTRPTNPTTQEYQRETETEHLRLQLLQKTPTFGFKNLVADWLLLQFLQYFGDEPARNVTGYPLVIDYFRLILHNDPRFSEAYTFLSTTGTLYAAQPHPTDQIMAEGIKHLTPKIPDRAYYILRQRAINQLLFLGDSQASRQTFIQAAQWAQTYNDEESRYVASLSLATAQFLKNNPNSKIAQAATWGLILQSVQDQRTRQIAIDNIQRLGGRIITLPNGQPQIILPQRD